MSLQTTELPTNCEQWASISGYTNYEVSWFGRVRNSKTGRILKSNLSSNTYLTLGLSQSGVVKTYSVHVLVAREWVANPDNKRCVDHIDGDKKNNHFENLRWATHSENIRNSKAQTNRSSIYKGVSYSKPANKWVARLKLHGKDKHLGCFDCEKEAAEAYNKAATEHYGEYAKLNEFIG